MRPSIVTPRALARWIATATAAALAACASAPPPRLLSLPLPPSSSREGPSLQAIGAPASVTPQVLAVRRINIPEYLHSDKVRYRASESVLAEWPGVAWAERLDGSMTEQLVLRLRQALPGWTVCERACPATAVSMSLTVDIMPLDYVRAEGRMRALARWQLVPRPAGSRVPADAKTATTGAPPAAVLSGQRALQEPVTPDNAEGQAAALARVVDAVAQGVASALNEAPAQPASGAAPPYFQ